MQSETGFPSSHQLKSYVAFKSRLKLAARAVLSADAGLLVKSNSISFFIVVVICLVTSVFNKLTRYSLTVKTALRFVYF